MNTKTNVLIVDDDPRNIRILYEILGDSFELMSSPDGEQALDDVKKCTPDIILLDIMMPGIDGYEVCKTLKDSDQYKDIKIILVSGKALTEERVKGYESGADDFVTKPFDMDEILAKVNVFSKLKSMEEVNRLKSDFLSLINHEMGTPLNHIIGISDLLVKQAVLDNAISASIKDMGDAAHLLSDKINNILFLSKLKQSVGLNLIELDAKNLISDVIQLLGKSSSEVNITYEIDNGLVFKGDFELMQQLFIYLLATPTNESPVLCRISYESSCGISIDIETMGDKISGKKIQNYFNPFYIEDVMLHSEGMNITMGICAQIVEMHQGNIAVRNTDTGICISIWLPSSQRP